MGGGEAAAREGLRTDIDLPYADSRTAALTSAPHCVGPSLLSAAALGLDFLLLHQSRVLQAERMGAIEAGRREARWSTVFGARQAGGRGLLATTTFLSCRPNCLLEHSIWERYVLHESGCLPAVVWGGRENG